MQDLWLEPTNSFQSNLRLFIVFISKAEKREETSHPLDGSPDVCDGWGSAGAELGWLPAASQGTQKQEVRVMGAGRTETQASKGGFRAPRDI